jgi:hypothetical protein
MAAAALIVMLETPMTGQPPPHTVLAATVLLLGPVGHEAHLEDATEMRARNQIPVLLAMLVDTDTMTFSTTAIPRPVLH